MRSAQIPFGTWAIMKKFIYMCNEIITFLSRLYDASIAIIYEQTMNIM